LTGTVRSRVALLCALTILVVLEVTGAGGAGAAQGSAKKATAQASAAPPTLKAILFAADGMRPDLVDRYAGQGFLPTMQALMQNGVKGQNGLL
jgi:alkaline phosphatase